MTSIETNVSLPKMAIGKVAAKIGTGIAKVAFFGFVYATNAHEKATRASDCAPSRKDFSQDEWLTQEGAALIRRAAANGVVSGTLGVCSIIFSGGVAHALHIPYNTGVEKTLVKAAGFVAGVNTFSLGFGLMQDASRIYKLAKKRWAETVRPVRNISSLADGKEPPKYDKF